MIEFYCSCVIPQYHEYVDMKPAIFLEHFSSVLH